MRFDILTLFPEIFSGYLGQSLLKKAIDASLVQVQVWNLRNWATGKHLQVDDRPFGGGPGMVMMVEPIVTAVEALQDPVLPSGHLVMLSPQGRQLNQKIVEQLSGHPRLIMLCGRYEGFDQRVTDILRPDEISIGDFVLNGGEVAAMVLIDTLIRLVPGVLGDECSSVDDSFSSGNRWLECPQYTRPREFRGRPVPDILLSGDHGQIARWRKEQSYERTRQRRADLLDRSDDCGQELSPDEKLSQDTGSPPRTDGEP
jgi:tRNA (guanine37-N1)-methyltransferase